MRQVVEIAFGLWLVMVLLIIGYHLAGRIRPSLIAEPEDDDWNDLPPDSAAELDPASEELAGAGPLATTGLTNPTPQPEPSSLQIEDPVSGSALQDDRLAAMLSGVEYPAQLTPIHQTGPSAETGRSGSSHVDLLASGSRASDAGPALADELERNGFVLEPISEAQLLATRPQASRAADASDDVIRLTMFTEPEDQFPGVGADDVVIRIENANPS